MLCSVQETFIKSQMLLLAQLDQVYAVMCCKASFTYKNRINKLENVTYGFRQGSVAVYWCPMMPKYLLVAYLAPPNKN